MALLGKDILNAIKTRIELRMFKEISEVNPDERIEQKTISRKESLSICFVIPGIERFKGGITSILRLGTYLEEMGNRVFYASMNRQKEKEMGEKARINLPYFKGKTININTLKKMEFDIGIATYWLSAYFIQNNQHLFKEKYYFIQDFEPAFYPIGDLHYLALNTYRLGFKLISLGGWNAKKIEESTGEQCFVVEFPFEIKQYTIVEKEIKIQKDINIAIYLKTIPKRGPLLLLTASKKLKNMLKKKGLNPKIMFFGLERFVSTGAGVNMGKLTTERLKQLYSKCHIGIVASYTNISLVPYEMIACGLPVFEAKDGSAPFFFNEKEMVFYNSFPEDIVKKVSFYLDNQEKLNEILKNAQIKIKDKTWKNTAKQFEKILKTT